MWRNGAVRSPSPYFPRPSWTVCVESRNLYRQGREAILTKGSACRGHEESGRGSEHPPGVLTLSQRLQKHCPGVSTCEACKPFIPEAPPPGADRVELFAQTGEAAVPGASSDRKAGNDAHIRQQGPANRITTRPHNRHDVATVPASVC